MDGVVDGLDFHVFGREGQVYFEGLCLFGQRVAHSEAIFFEFRSHVREGLGLGESDGLIGVVFYFREMDFLQGFLFHQLSLI